MSWFDAAKFSKYAKTALKHAQKNIDKVLDIQDDDGEGDSTRTAPVQLPVSYEETSNNLLEVEISETDSVQFVDRSFVEEDTVTDGSFEEYRSSHLDLSSSARKGKLKDRKLGTKLIKNNISATDDTLPSPDIDQHIDQHQFEKLSKQADISRDNLFGETTLFNDGCAKSLLVDNGLILDLQDDGLLTTVSSEEKICINTIDQSSSELSLNTSQYYDALDDSATCTNSCELREFNKPANSSSLSSTSENIKDIKRTLCVERDLDLHLSVDGQESFCSESAECLETNQPTKDITDHNEPNEKVVLCGSADTPEEKHRDTVVQNESESSFQLNNFMLHAEPSISVDFNPVEYDPLESIMKQTESLLITPSVDNAVDDEDRSEDVNDSPVYTERIPEVIMDNDFSSFIQVDQLNEEISDLNCQLKQLQSVIEARETKIMNLSKENISLNESISVYQNQINQLELVNQGDDQEMENLRQEFTKRIAECDIKCQAAIKERDNYKVKLVETEASLRQSSNEQVSVLTNSLLEKEETIKDLLSEGEILAKKELEKNTHIKKMRVKLKELTTKNTAFVDQVTNLEVEVQKFKALVEEKEINEKRLEGEVRKLEGITDSQEDEVSCLKDRLEDMEEQYKAIDSTLKNSYSEINRLNLENCQKSSEIQDSSNAKEDRKILEDKLRELEKTSRLGKEELMTQLEDLQSSYSRLEHQLSRREDELKREIEDLHSRLEHAMYRNQELSQSVSAATKPLLRQIENLQNTYSAQSEGWELVEKSLNDRIVSIQDQLSLALEKERTASEVAVEATSKLKAIKTKESVFRNEKINLQIALDKEINRRKEIESEWKCEKSNYETKLSKLKMYSEQLEGERKVLEEQLTAERVKYETDTLRMSTQITLQQQQQQQQLSEVTQSLGSSRQSSRSSSISGDIIESNSSKNLSDTPLDRYLSRSSSIHDGLQKGAVTTTAASVEHLKSQLRSREGEVFVLQEQLKESEKRKASLAQELVNLSNQVEELEGCSAELIKLKEGHSDLSSRYNAVLQMYGEKAEEAEELKMDIQDVKNMYRQQIQQLCSGPR